MRPSARGHKYKLCKNICASRVRSAFFSERIVNVWTSLPRNVDFRRLISLSVLFRLSILLNFLDVLLKRKCLNCQLACVNCFPC